MSCCLQYLLHFDSRPSKSGIKGGQGSVADYAEDFAAFTGAQGGGGDHPHVCV